MRRHYLRFWFKGFGFRGGLVVERTSEIPPCSKRGSKHVGGFDPSHEERPVAAHGAAGDLRKKIESDS